MTPFNLPYTLAFPSREVRRLYDGPVEARPPDQHTVDWLFRLGVSWNAITRPWSIHVARAIFDGRGRYLPSPIGGHSLLLLGADLLGVDGRGTLGLPIPAYPDVLSWLRADRLGLVIVQWGRTAARLAGIAIEPRDEPDRVDSFAGELGRRLVVPRPLIVRRRAESRSVAA